MTKVHEITKLGQSVWLDYIRRSFLDSGGLSDMVEQGVRGVTSNPSIFEKAIAGSDDYDDQLRELADAGKSVDEIYEALVLRDITQAADILRPVYDESGGADGYVSLEVSPALAHDTQGTLDDARRLFKALGRPNVMIKVPATPEGIPAFETLISEGININVTLMFSLAQYDAVAEAYISGLEKLAANGGDVSKVASVASFFVSRVDGKTDPALDAKGNDTLKGKIAIANARAAYGRFEAAFSGERWQKLTGQGAQVQRPLWASTSTKNPDYPDTLYVDTLIAPHTVNTMPNETLDATLDHGATEIAITAETIAQAQNELVALESAGVDLDAITDDLLAEGVKKFADSFDALIASIKDKREQLVKGAV